MPSSSNLCFHALALDQGLLPRDVLDRALAEAEARGRPLERHLVETGAVPRDGTRELEVRRSKLARACAACRKVTYLLPRASEADTPCEHCGGALDPATAPRSGPHAAPAKRAPASGPHGAPTKRAPSSGSHAVPAGQGPRRVESAAPAVEPQKAEPAARSAAPAAAKRAPSSGSHTVPAKPEPKRAAPSSGSHVVPAKPARPAEQQKKAEPAPKAAPRKATPGPAPALLDDEDDGPPLPAKLGRARIEAILAQNERVVVYAGRVDDDRVAVRSLRPERAAKRRELDRFFVQAQAAAPSGLEPVDLGLDALGAPFLTIRRPDHLELGPVLLGLDSFDSQSGEHAGEGSSDTTTGIFEKLNREREQLKRDVSEASRRRERCVGRFVLLERLSADAGELWRSFDTDSNELVAVRVMPAGRATDGGRLLKDVEERLAAVKRARHAHLVPLREYGVDGGRLFLAREHVVGRPLTANSALELVVGQVHQAAQALAYLHAQGASHGGLHPGNVVVRADRSVVLLGLGTGPAAAAAGEATLAWRLLRAGCSPPEWTPGQADDAAGDVHALGALLFRAAVHHLPDEPAPFDGKLALKDDVLAIALRCLAPDPRDRYPGASELARDLDRLEKGQPSQARELRKPAPDAVRPGSGVMDALSGVFKKWLGRE